MIIRRLLLAPVSLIWLLVTEIRNRLFDWGILESYRIPKKSICIGNLSVGGTGKTPMTSYLAEMFYLENKVQILSRGYGRKSKGFLNVSISETSENAGDEPLFYKLKFKENIQVAVCEKRKAGIEQIGTDNFDLLLLDDAYQHRHVKAGFTILLTSYSNIFIDDYLLPSGTLRESQKNANRSDCIVITKCPQNLSSNEKKSIENKLTHFNKPIFFSQISYQSFVCFGKPVETMEKLILVSGIANPKPLVEFLQKSFQIELIQFPDHHQFSKSEIEEIHRKIDTFANDKTAILTTEKDFARLHGKINDWKLNNYPWYYIPIQLEIENEKEFKSLINNYVRAI
jgi:tetraacyldisaccharide 4'-kinase